MSLEDTEQNVAALHAALNELRARGYELNEQRRLAVAILQHLQAERRSVAAASMQKLSALRSDIAAATLLHEHLVAKRRRMEHECALREKTLLSHLQRKDDKTQPSAKRIGPPLSAATKMALQELRKKSDMTEQKWAFSAAFRVMVRKQNLHKAGVGKVGAGLTGLGPDK